MQLHLLNQGKTTAPKTRVGRGGKRGTTAGRGTKGQRSRSGHRIRPAIRDLVIRIPKRRGFRNKPTSPKALSVNLSRVAEKIASRAKKGETFVLSLTALKEMGLVASSFRGMVKVLGSGTMPFPVRLGAGVLASSSAKAAIDASAGAVAPRR